MKRVFLSLLLLFVLVAPILANQVIFTSPAGGEVWYRGQKGWVTFGFSMPIIHHFVALYRNGVYLGDMAHGSWDFSNGQTFSFAWTVGRVTETWDYTTHVWVPSGNYTLGVGTFQGNSPLESDYQNPMGFSQPFTIIDLSVFFAKYNKLVLGQVPVTGGCPECFILDLAGLRDELIQLKETMTLNLYWKGKLVANLGNIGMGKGFAAKLQVKLGADALAAVKRGEEFELRLFSGRNLLLHTQAVRLMAAGR